MSNSAGPTNNRPSHAAPPVNPQQQHIFPPPLSAHPAFAQAVHPGAAPPPPPQVSSTRRPPAQQLGISTAVSAAQRFGAHLQTQTPSSPRVGGLVSPASPIVASATTFSSTSSPMSSTRYSSSSATSTYNPQEWARSGPGSGHYVPHSGMIQSRRAAAANTRDATGMEASLPSPPPPYSMSPQSSLPATRAQYGSPLAGSFTSQTSSPVMHASGFSSPVTPATSVSTGGMPSGHRSMSGEHHYSAVTPQQQPSPTTFPPPPPLAGQRDRSTSRSRFGLSALTGRNRTSSNASTTVPTFDVTPQQSSVAPTRTPQAPSPSAFTVPANVAPSARRAASTGCIGTTNNGPLRRPAEMLLQGNQNEPQNHGFALPPPPPGPPPNVRSQSLSRVGQSSAGSSTDMSAGIVAPLALRTNSNQSQRLGPVPPTPADWVEEDIVRHLTPHQQHSASHQFHTSPASSSTEPSQVREHSISRGIRERRSEARARAQVASRDVEPSNELADVEPPSPTGNGEVRPANLVLASSTGALSRRRHVAKAKTSPLVDGSGASPSMQRRQLDSDDVMRSLPGSAGLNSDGQVRSSAPPTPFSPGQASHAGVAIPSTLDRTENRSRTELRPSSRLAQSPNIPSAGITNPERLDFAEASLARYVKFVGLEAKATTDQERLELFAEFFVHESRLRRDRYTEAFEALGSDVLDLTRDMWRSLEGPKRKTPTSSQALSGRFTPDNQTSNDNEAPPEPSSAGSQSGSGHALTPATEPDSPSDQAANHARIRSESRNAFQPMLSPIPSMAMSTAADEESVRGRTASRWWEASSDGFSSGTGNKPFRTKRESKYMGLPREARESLQWIPEDSPGLAGPSFYAGLGPNEYPPEKASWNEAAHVPEPEPFRQASKKPMTPKLDVSRLVTLPPPYPRHYPAVNNHHPDLNAQRATLRSLNLTEEVTKIRQNYQNDETTIRFRPDSPAAWADRRRKMRLDIQQKVAAGNMSFAAAAKKEAEFESDEARRGRERAQQSFDHFQAQVVGPLNAQYNSRLNHASATLEVLIEGLSNEASSHNPNATQEEGDEQPELLEKLTLVKWLHEAREQLYKDMTELEDESNEHYKTIILFPYRQSGNRDKVQEVESFFAKDLADRRETYERKSLKRYEELLRIMEKHVTRGVETQLSAFWDIAPELTEVLQRIPTDLSRCDVAIPAIEYEENPAYDEFPLQYLYTLLLHAERSAYQFIESQVNLQCLLHEVKTSVMVAGCRLMRTQRWMAGEEAHSVEAEMREIGRSEEATLTAELKERAATVEEQWRQALGTGIRDCQQRIRARLLEQGGFDDGLDD